MSLHIYIYIYLGVAITFGTRRICDRNCRKKKLNKLFKTHIFFKHEISFFVTFLKVTSICNPYPEISMKSSSYQKLFEIQSYRSEKNCGDSQRCGLKILKIWRAVQKFLRAESGLKIKKVRIFQRKIGFSKLKIILKKIMGMCRMFDIS